LLVLRTKEGARTPLSSTDILKVGALNLRGAAR
jgi:hypothetical protein